MARLDPRIVPIDPPGITFRPRFPVWVPWESYRRSGSRKLIKIHQKSTENQYEIDRKSVTFEQKNTEMSKNRVCAGITVKVTFFQFFRVFLTFWSLFDTRGVPTYAKTLVFPLRNYMGKISNFPICVENRRFQRVFVDFGQFEGFWTLFGHF